MRHFKARNLAFVRIDGGKRKLYLRKRGAPETKAAYRRFIAELASGVSVGASSVRGDAIERVVCVAEFADVFWANVESDDGPCSNARSAEAERAVYNRFSTA